mgnify:CR=1 FL=1|jgi:hypothetical protein
MKQKLQPDTLAENITFGVELETYIPTAAGVAVGDYHCGYPVVCGHTPSGERLPAPLFNGVAWKAD